jgi:hypothetical protein
MKVVRRNSVFEPDSLDEILEFKDIFGVEPGEPLHLNNRRHINRMNGELMRVVIHGKFPNHLEKLIKFLLGSGLWFTFAGEPSVMFFATSPDAQLGDDSVFASGGYGQKTAEHGYMENLPMEFFVNETDDYPWPVKTEAKRVGDKWVQTPVDKLPTWGEPDTDFYIIIQSLSEHAAGDPPPFTIGYWGTDVEGDEVEFAPGTVVIQPPTGPAVDPTISLDGTDIAGAKIMPLDNGDAVLYLPAE